VKRNAAFFFISVCILASAYAGAEDVRVEPTITDVVEAKPRAVVTAAFRVSNVGEQKREFLTRVSLPPDWQLVTEQFPFQLAPGQSDIRLVSFLTPSTALAGTYRVSYSLSDTTAPSVSETSTISVLIPPVVELEANLLVAPRYIIAGEEYRASFLVVNRGNSPSTVAVKVESSEDYPAEIDAESLELDPGGSGKVTASVKTDQEIRQKVMHRLRLTATTRGPEGLEVSASARSFAEVIPRIAGTVDPFHRLPMKVAFRGLMDTNREREQGFQGEIAGSGTLDEQGSKRLDFLFRGPDLQDISFLGEQDEYRLSYETEKYAVHLGDRGYSLSPLTELYSYGRGAEGSLNLGNFRLGAFHEQSRWLEPKEEQTAASLGYRLSENYAFSLNYLKKNESGRQSRPERLAKAIFSASEACFNPTRILTSTSSTPSETGSAKAEADKIVPTTSTFWGITGGFRIISKPLTRVPIIPATTETSTSKPQG
jgi:hypothetical protein